MKLLLKIVVTVTFAAVCVLFLQSPSTHMQTFLKGINVWANNVLPALFPFAVLTTLALQQGYTTKGKLCQKVFGVPCKYALCASLLCGYPIGAKAVADSTADTNTATYMCSFCSIASPFFVLITVGAKLLANTTATAITMATQLLACLVNGLLFKRICKHNCATQEEIPYSTLGEILTSSILSILTVGGLVALFFMLTGMASSLLPPQITNSAYFAFAIGLLEMTNGIIAVCDNCNLPTATVLTNALLAFGGICVLMQCFSFVSVKGVKLQMLALMKATQCALASIISFVLSAIFL